MRSFVFTVVSFLMVATAAFSQKAIVPPSSNDGSQNDEQQIRKLESEILKGEMDSDPAVFERILADDYLILNDRRHSGPTKATLVEGVRKAQGHAPSYTARVEGMQVYILGDTAIAMYVKEYAARAKLASQVLKSGLYRSKSSRLILSEMRIYRRERDWYRCEGISLR